MSKDEDEATLRGQKTMAVERARGFARELVMQNWAKHTSLPNEIQLKNAAFDSVMEAVTGRIRGGETEDSLRTIVSSAFRDWELARKKA